jgi:hypothetical protein
MKRLLLAALLIPATAKAEWSFPDPERFTSLYQLFSYHPEVDLSIPLCEQESTKQWSYVDSRCYHEIPFDYASKCYAWDCPAPYDHVFVEPITGTRKVVRGNLEELDAHYRSARSALIQPEFRSKPVKAKKPKKTKGKK